MNLSDLFALSAVGAALETMQEKFRAFDGRLGDCRRKWFHGDAWDKGHAAKELRSKFRGLIDELTPEEIIALTAVACAAASECPAATPEIVEVSCRTVEYYRCVGGPADGTYTTAGSRDRADALSVGACITVWGWPYKLGGDRDLHHVRLEPGEYLFCGGPSNGATIAFPEDADGPGRGDFVQFDGDRYEFIDGSFYYNPAPGSCRAVEYYRRKEPEKNS